MFRVLVSDKLGQPGLDALAAADDVDFDVSTSMSEADLIAAIGDYDALIIRSGAYSLP